MPHLLIAFASPPPAEDGDAFPMVPALPNLGALLARLDATSRDDGDELSLSPPHERALARGLGLAGGDGLLPWAAHFARQDGIDPGDRAWGLLTPAHWQVGTDAVLLADPDALDLDTDASRELMHAVEPLFDGDGFALQWGAPTRWYLTHPSLRALPTASLDRVIGRNIDRWLPGGAAARTIRRLQSEVKMLLHAHPLNAGREARGLLPVNSFWLSGCGIEQRPSRDRADLRVLDALRRPALAGDAAAWAQAWQALDAGTLADALRSREAVTLTLAGERSSQRFEPSARSKWSRWLNRKPDVAATLRYL